jgi:hypothetical protein
MNDRSLWKYLPPYGPVLSFLLIGLVLLSGLLYYRAIRIQRFLEPALALSRPQNEFTKSISRIFQKEYGTEPVRGLRVKSSAILVEKSLLFAANGSLKASAQVHVQKLSRIFLSLMEDSHTRSDISLVLIIGRYPSGGASKRNAVERQKVQRMVGSIQDALFYTAPALGIRYSTYFVAAAQPTNPHEESGEALEFRIIPSEFLHVEMLEKLNKYAF